MSAFLIESITVKVGQVKEQEAEEYHFQSGLPMSHLARLRKQAACSFVSSAAYVKFPSLLMATYDHYFMRREVPKPLKVANSIPTDHSLSPLIPPTFPCSRSSHSCSPSYQPSVDFMALPGRFSARFSPTSSRQPSVGSKAMLGRS